MPDASSALPPPPLSVPWPPAHPRPSRCDSWTSGTPRRAAQGAVQARCLAQPPMPLMLALRNVSMTLPRPLLLPLSLQQCPLSLRFRSVALVPGQVRSLHPGMQPGWSAAPLASFR